MLFFKNKFIKIFNTVGKLILQGLPEKEWRKICFEINQQLTLVSRRDKGIVKIVRKHTLYWGWKHFFSYHFYDNYKTTPLCPGYILWPGKGGWIKQYEIIDQWAKIKQVKFF